MEKSWLQNRVRKKKTIVPRCVAAGERQNICGLCGAPGNKRPFLSPWKGLVEHVWQFQGRKSQGRYFARKKMVLEKICQTRRQKSVDFAVLFSEDVVQFSKTPVPPLAKLGAKNASAGPGPVLQGACMEMSRGEEVLRIPPPTPRPGQLHPHHH